ncbi:NAD-dependent epimerase/dehydratase family protein [Lentisalinibacter salinarum]|uniref:NAD-dependent epimerase/dehydratase family protein n=1 Tax=Lentisalinibacter salinarum TaxID=2992239 RepID=UPI003865C9D6
MKVFVTGTDGYIGAVLAPRLMQESHEVVGFDTGYYRRGWLFTDPSYLSVAPLSICGDLRKVGPDLLEGVDAVVHLAELSNDPLGESNREVTFDINHRGSVRLAEAAKAAGVKRFIYTSSCSVYGVADEAVVDESSAVNPQTAYAECKVRVEEDIGGLADKDFAPVFLRNATAYGASPRMRFDIVLNNLAGLAWTTGKIAMTSDGTPWRPIVHIEDIGTAILNCLTAPVDTINGEIFNVGADSENYRIREIAEIVKEVFPECELTFGPSGGDNRSYRVSFEKISAALPGFRCRWTAREGALQLRRVFERIGMRSEDFEAAPYTRLKCIRELIATGQIDDSYFWTV